MSRIKTLIAGALIMTGLSVPARAQDDLVLIFAGCTGRISAEMEFAWLMGDVRADALQAQRQRFVSILDAVMPTERARETLNHRVEAKLAHSAMLTTAHFGTDARLSRLAKQQTQLNVQTCRTLLLES
ncbi:hypothetical protein [uncultured Tateyamaria sp.]|uniref:hypothetical protein n=1 Tax=uncultured Tateyamaria sp. TaxID=455651 RepID=UPI002614D66E|nr:hypothetical protein [uncultured Tateyamaria sp.]